MKIMVTGGAGFIGSHMADFLSKENEVIIYDNFSSGKMEFLSESKAEIVRGNILDFDKLLESMKGVEVVYHMAADPDVKESYPKPMNSFNQNVLGTQNVLEASRRCDVKNFVFASSSTVYGEAEKIPTSEKEQIVPISNYGGTKAASENMIMTYSHLYGIKGVLLRYANIIGPRLTHGVIFDFYNKLMRNPKELEILGDGKQNKSYLHVKDCVEVSVLCSEKSKKPFDMFNIGSEESLSVVEMADVICNTMNLKDVKYNFTGGDRGWKGDVPKFMLDISKVKNIGWNPSKTIAEAVGDTVGWLKK